MLERQSEASMHFAAALGGDGEGAAVQIGNYPLLFQGEFEQGGS